MVLLLQSKVHELGSFAYKSMCCVLCVRLWRTVSGRRTYKKSIDINAITPIKGENVSKQYFFAFLRTLFASRFGVAGGAVAVANAVRSFDGVTLILLIELYEPNYTVVKCTALCNITPFLLVVIDAYVCVSLVSIMAMPLRTPFKISTIR